MKRYLLVIIYTLALIELILSLPVDPKDIEIVVADDDGEAVVEPEPSSPAVKSEPKERKQQECPILLCTRIFAPVCGDDGKTYPSVCRMNAENCESKKAIKKVADGPCDPAPEPEPASKTAIKTAAATTAATSPATKAKKS